MDIYDIIKSLRRERAGLLERVDELTRMIRTLGDAALDLQRTREPIGPFKDMADDMGAFLGRLGGDDDDED